MKHLIMGLLLFLTTPALAGVTLDLNSKESQVIVHSVTTTKNGLAIEGILTTNNSGTSTGTVDFNSRYGTLGISNVDLFGDVMDSYEAYYTSPYVHGWGIHLSDTEKALSKKLGPFELMVTDQERMKLNFSYGDYNASATTEDYYSVGYQSTTLYKDKEMIGVMHDYGDFAIYGEYGEEDDHRFVGGIRIFF